MSNKKLKPGISSFIGLLKVSNKIINATNVINNNINILKKGVFTWGLWIDKTFCALLCSAWVIILSTSKGIFSSGLTLLILISFFLNHH